MRIRLTGLNKRYGKVHALKNASLTVEPGQIVSVLGPNGAGKTTLLRCLAGIVGATSGDIFFDEERFTRGNMSLRRRIAFLPDFPHRVSSQHSPSTRRDGSEAVRGASA